MYLSVHLSMYVYIYIFKENYLERVTMDCIKEDMHVHLYMTLPQP